MKNMLSNILVVAVMFIAIYVFVEMILALLGKIPPQHVSYSKETALSIMMLWLGITFLVLAVLFFMFDI